MKTDLGVHFAVTPDGEAASLTKIRGVSASGDHLSCELAVSQRVRSESVAFDGLVAKAALPDMVTSFQDRIHWTAEVDGQIITLGDRGSHKVCVTLDTLQVARPNNSVHFALGILACGAWAYAASFCTPARARSATTTRQSMAGTFTNKVVQQLLNPPETSRKALDQAVRGPSPPIPKGAKFALAEARSYLNGWLRTELRPPSKTIFVAFSHEAGLYDVVRARYRTKECSIEVAQSQHILVLRIRGLKSRSGSSTVQRIGEAARRTFLEGDRIHPKATGADAKYEYGEQSQGEGGPIDPEWPHWIDSLHWFANQDELGFVLLKASGGPTRAVIGFAEELNSKWFEP